MDRKKHICIGMCNRCKMTHWKEECCPSCNATNWVEISEDVIGYVCYVCEEVISFKNEDDISWINNDNLIFIWGQNKKEY